MFNGIILTREENRWKNPRAPGSGRWTSSFHAAIRQKHRISKSYLPPKSGTFLVDNPYRSSPSSPIPDWGIDNSSLPVAVAKYDNCPKNDLWFFSCDNSSEIFDSNCHWLTSTCATDGEFSKKMLSKLDVNIRFATSTSYTSFNWSARLRPTYESNPLAKIICNFIPRKFCCCSLAFVVPKEKWKKPNLSLA